MSNINIIIWYNEENQESADFAEGFANDLNKCLVRFGKKGNLFPNPQETPQGIHLLILSNNDYKAAGFSDKCRNLLQNIELMLLLLEPVEQSDHNIGQVAQPVLFWDKLYDTGEIRLFRRDKPESQVIYWEKLTDVVIEIIDRSDTRVSKSKRPSVYLSQVDISHNADRENLKRDLIDIGYDVMPEKMPSTNINECTDQIIEALRSSRLIIHIIPPTYISFFTNQHISLTEHQCNISAAFLAREKSSINRLIWISSAHEISDEENQVFVERIQRDQEQTRDSLVLKSSVEDIKKLYRQILAGTGNGSISPKAGPDVYLVSDTNHNSLPDTLRKSLNRHNLTIETNFSGITYNQHMQILAYARIVLLVYSDENEQWLRVKVNDILKSKGIESFRPFEKIIMVKGGNNYDTRLYEGSFTHILPDIEELPSLLSENQNKTN